MDGMWQAAKSAAQLLRAHRNDTVRIVTHIDADALSAAGIAATCLTRAGIDYRVTYCKSLDDAMLQRLADDAAQVSWFTDLGSAVHHQLGPGDKIITDHHEILRADGANDFPHVNPHMHGIPEDDSISGAGCAYYVSTAFDAANADLAGTALVGALGDLQDHRLGRLVGLNRRILGDGEAHGVVRASEGLRFYGRSTRPLPKFLRYAEPKVPGLDSEDAAVELLVSAGIRVRDGPRWRTWLDLDHAERNRLLATLDRAYGGATGHRGECYDLPRETEPELRCAKEFSTILNSTARYDRPEIGLALAMGTRGPILSEARALLQGHRRSLGDALQLAQKKGLTTLGPIAYFDAQTGIRDTILGIVTGILLGQAGPTHVLVGLADNREGGVKVSARAPEPLVRAGADLSRALQSAAGSVGGSGGGHAGAAGATVPRGSEAAFLERLSRLLATQLEPAAVELESTRL